MSAFVLDERYPSILPSLGNTAGALIACVLPFALVAAVDRLELEVDVSPRSRFL
jgi:hypothetical protein